MKRPPLPPDETGRLQELQSYQVLDTLPEAEYDELTELAASICQAPIALISLIDEQRQWFKSRHGLDDSETERDIAFCAHAILHSETLVVEDASRDERFADNPLVTAEPKIRFYAGSPLITPRGHALGTLCVIDRVPRRLTADHERALRLLSRHLMTLLELRRLRQEAGARDRRPVPLPDTAEQQLQDAERARLALLSVLEDQKQIEDRLRAGEQRYRLLFERNPAPMLVYERASLRILAVNDAFSRHYGYSHAEARALVLTDLYPADERPRIVELAARLQGYADAGEWHHLRKDGSRITIVASSHDTDFDGRVARIAVITDVTARKQAELEIQKLNQALEDRVQLRTRELEVANKELETFTYSVSHDLKAPLRGIDGYSRLLIEDYRDRLDDEGRLFLDNVRHGVELMSQLIEDLLAYSRMERHGMQRSEVDLTDAVQAVLDERRSELEELGVAVETELDSLVARADPEGLATVLRNLVDNALKFSRASTPPRLTIQARAQSDAILLTVTDNGIGFDMRFHDRIFEIFQRLQRSEDYPGTGVGLAIVRKAVQRMGGRIRAESGKGRGATFLVELPR